MKITHTIWLVSKHYLFSIALVMLIGVVMQGNGQPAFSAGDESDCKVSGTNAGNNIDPFNATSKEHPTRPQVGDTIEIRFSSKYNVSNMQSYKLCVFDETNNFWSLKKQFTPKGSNNYSFDWCTSQAAGCAKSNAGSHKIRVIAQERPPTVKKYIKDKSFTLNEALVDAPPPPDSGGGTSGDGSGTGTGGGTTNGDNTGDPGLGDIGQGGAAGGAAGGAGGAESTSKDPQFGVDAIKKYFAGISNFKSEDISDVVIKIINLLLGFIAIGAFIAIIVGGIQYMTSFGNEEKAATAKRTIVYAVTGVIISIALITIITVINRELKQIVSPVTMTEINNHA